MTGSSPSAGTGRPPFRTAPQLPDRGTPSPGADATPTPTQWAAILTDLAERGVATADVELVSARQVTWNDGSLGCPTPGVQYTQAQVEGMRVVVEADARQFDFRFGRTDTPTLCENPGPRSTSSNR